ncbi:universal stress protein UspA [Streptomyces solincola]|uniref:Universal stress protein UspA n=1 Tax=Streptomyces solincola TaxID=2100817 RepID=A0A2S9Q263_9ACTN|nr:universal stress protein [Streptomyces solincola]PRH80770.1 universal stress protein UspA [Streptomyces solincola]
MTGDVIVGLDGSPESRAAARWAAEEARLSGSALRLVHVVEWPGVPEVPLYVLEADEERAGELLRRTAARLATARPDVGISMSVLRGRPPAELSRILNETDGVRLGVLGSRGLGRLTGFLTGSVSAAVAARAAPPVVLVRGPGPGARPEDADAGPQTEAGAVVVGVDVRSETGEVLGFAFREAALHDWALHAVHVWRTPVGYGQAEALDLGLPAELEARLAKELDEAVAPWTRAFPRVPVTADCVTGPTAPRLLAASDGAALVVVGRRHRGPLAGARLGPVAQAVVHHATSPVALVAHD